MAGREDGHATADTALARAGGLWGLVGAIFLGALRDLNADGPERDDVLAGVAFLVAYAAPFAVALGARHLAEPVPRAGLWLGTGLLAFLLSFTAFSGVSLLLLPAAGLLLLAAWRAYRAPGRAAAWPVLPLTAVFVAVGVLAFGALLARDDPRCWALVRSPDGGTAWEARPADSSVGSARTGDSGSVEGMTCTSDVISRPEAAFSLGLWSVAAVVLIAVLTRRRPRPGRSPLGAAPRPP